MWCLIGLVVTAVLMAFNVLAQGAEWHHRGPWRRRLFAVTLWSMPVVMAATLIHAFREIAGGFTAVP